MVLRNHIAYRFLTDPDFWMEMVEASYPNLYSDYDKNNKEVPEEITSLYHCFTNGHNKSYIVTQSVVQHLDKLKLKKDGAHYNWKVFNNLPNQKLTFIFHDGTLLRMIVAENTIWFCHLKFTRNKDSKLEGQSYWVMFNIDRQTLELCSHFDHPDVINLEEHVYKFLCFFFLTENTEEIIPPGRKYGTKKTGKIRNDFKFPVTVVTSKWNITTIRTDGFDVSGHFRVQPCGKGRMNYEIIFIEPFRKTGYIRKSNKEIQNV